MAADGPAGPDHQRRRQRHGLLPDLDFRARRALLRPGLQRGDVGYALAHDHGFRLHHDLVHAAADDVCPVPRHRGCGHRAFAAAADRHHWFHRDAGPGDHDVVWTIDWEFPGGVDAYVEPAELAARGAGGEQRRRNVYVHG